MRTHHTSHLTLSALLLALGACKFPELPRIGDDGGTDAADVDAPDVDAPSTDAASIDAPTDAPPTDAPPGAWLDPSPVRGVSSDTQPDKHPALSDDGLTLAFGRYVDALGTEIFVATRASTSLPFSSPIRVPELGTGQNETAPVFSTTGREIFFVRTPSGSFDDRIYVASRPSASVAWGTPSDTGLRGRSPDISGDGLTLYYVPTLDSCTGDTTACVMRATRTAIGQPFGTPEEIDLPPGTSYSSIDLSNDELSILLSGRRRTGIPVMVVGTRNSRTASFTTPLAPVFGVDPHTTADTASWSSNRREIYFSMNPSVTDDLYLTAQQE
jgi:hypothetical protein